MSDQHNFDEFMSRLPQWARLHVIGLQEQITQLQRRLEGAMTELDKESEGATIWLKRGGHLDPDIPLNGGDEAYPGARQYAAVRFSDDAERQYAGIQVRWANQRAHSRPDDSSDWLEIRGDRPLELRASASNSFYIREVER